MKKSLILLLALIVTAFSLVACASPAENTGENASESTNASSEPTKLVVSTWG